jgi:hypothetical protein
VLTRSSQYVLDLDHRWLIRTPDTPTGGASSPPRDGPTVLRRDWQPIRLLRLEWCCIGSGMVMWLAIRDDGVPTVRLTSEVLKIAPLTPTEDRPAPRRVAADTHATGAIPVSAHRAAGFDDARNRRPPSPVPADARLCPGELPFIAFGQFGDGHLDLRVFDQDVYWVDRRGVPHLLVELSLGYRHAVVAFLQDNVDYYYTATIGRLAATIVGDLLPGDISSELVARAADAPAVRTVTNLTPMDWLEGTPLMRRLRALEGRGTPRNVPRSLGEQ